MAHNLKDLSIGDTLKIVDSVWKVFDGRREKWGARRKIRFRQMDDELRALPLSKRAGGNKALMVFQTEEPNQEVHRRVKRLVANKIRIETIIYDTDDEMKVLAQEIKDSLKALYKWMNRGKVPAERLMVEYQQADGLGIGKLDLVADFADEALSDYDPEVLELEVDIETPSDESAEQTKARDLYVKAKASYGDDSEAPAKAYKDVTDRARRKCDPPFRMSAPDPLSCAYTLDGDNIDVFVEKGKRKLSSLLEAMSGHTLRLLNNRLVVVDADGAIAGDAAGAATIPENETLGAGYSDDIEYTEVRTRQKITILMRHPKLLSGRAQDKVKAEDGYVKIVFDNPFGPYSTGYVLCPGEITGSHDPADEFQPPILGTLALAQPLNVLGTIRLSAAIDTALAPKYIKNEDAQPPPQLSQGESDKTPTVKDSDPIPMIPGEVKQVGNPNIDLDKAEQQFNAMLSLYRFNEVLSGDSTSSDSGHKLAIQVSQADTQLVPFQNARAEATSEILMCCLYATKKLGVPIFVKEIPDRDSMMMNRIDQVQPVRAITPEMFDLDFNLIVSIGSETPVTKFAKWSALESRYKAGTLSYETLMEQSDVENVADEIARVFEGQTLVSVMQQAIPVIVQMIAAKTVAKINGPSPTVGEGGNANGGGMPGAEASVPVGGLGRLPGVGMSEGGPTSAELGPRVQMGAGDGQMGTG